MPNNFLPRVTLLENFCFFSVDVCAAVLSVNQFTNREKTEKSVFLPTLIPTHTHCRIQAGTDIGLLVSGNLTALHICAENGLNAALQSIVETDTGRKCCQIETVDGNRPMHLAGEHILVVC